MTVSTLTRGLTERQAQIAKGVYWVHAIRAREVADEFRRLNRELKRKEKEENS